MTQERKKEKKKERKKDVVSATYKCSGMLTHNMP